jgi:hypothetical protein
MTRSILLSLAATLIGLAAAFGLAEGALRVAGVSPELMYVPNPWYGWSHQPGARFVRETEGATVRIEINDLGLRDRPFALDKPEGTYRILVLGDSFIEALQVPLTHTFAKQLEAQLAPYGRKRGCTIEVMNGGVSAFGTDNSLLYYRHDGRRFEPDLVLLGFYLGNDIRNNWFELENIDAGGARKPHFVPRGDGIELVDYPFTAHASWSVPLKVFLNRHVWTYALLREVSARQRRAGTDEVRGLPLDYQLYAAATPTVWHTAWQVTEALLAEFAREVRQDGAELFVLLIPAQEQVEPRRFWSTVQAAGRSDPAEWNLDAPAARLGEILAVRGIAHLELLTDFRAAAARGEKLHLEIDAHWTAQGHQRAARRVAKALTARGDVGCQPAGAS